MQERTVHERIVRSQKLAYALAWLGFRYNHTEEGYKFERTPRFESAWKELHIIKQYYK